MENHNQNPQFIVYIGPMFSGKTSGMLSRLDRFKHQQKRLAVFKPTIDDRYGKAEVVTHSGLRFPAVPVKTGSDVVDNVLNLPEKADVVALDEVFMVPGSADALVFLYRNGYTIVASSIDTSSKVSPFIEVEKILPWATKIEKCSAVCTQCGRDAFFTYKKAVNDDLIQVGGSDLYEPRCFAHHPHVIPCLQ